jgi:nucleoside phosphorylase
LIAQRFVGHPNHSVTFCVESYALATRVITAPLVLLAHSDADTSFLTRFGTMTTLTQADYTVGWICALPVELKASIAMLDERHPPLSQETFDTNCYTLGRIGTHNVAMACLPAGHTGNNAAATVAVQIRRTFPSLRFGLMVGIGGAAPSAEHDIRLGDIIVSKPDTNSGGVIQYDFGKTLEGGEFEHTGLLNSPPEALLTAVSAVQADSSAPQSLAHYLSQHTDPELANPGSDQDQLFQADYNHIHEATTCEHCDKNKLEVRNPRDSSNPVVHYGKIASGNQVMRDGSTRESLRKKFDVLCFEMEAAGLMNSFPCIVIRGMCDYADTHKNKVWQPYAAASASAYAKALLVRVSAAHVARTATIPPTASSVYVFSRRLFPLNSLILGRFVIDIEKPWGDYHPDSLEIADNDISTTNYSRIREIFESARTGNSYGKLNKLFSSVTGFSLEEFASIPETTYFLLNSGKYFRKLCGEPETRGWLENTIKYGMTVYMIVGIHTVRPPSTPVDSGRGFTPNSINGENVLAIQYRKVGFRWFIRGAIERAFLKSKCRWAVGRIDGRGAQGDDDDEIVEAHFQDVIDEDDVKSEDNESYSLGGEMFVF